MISSAPAQAEGTVSRRELPLRKSTRSLLLPLLVSVILLGLAQGALALREPVFSPVDELEHTDYVRLVAEEHRLPIYGQDLISPVLRAVYLGTYPSLDLAPDQAAAWELRKYNYEALQFPAFYVLAAPVYALFDAPDPRGAIYAVRFLNVALSLLLLVQLTLLLSRRLRLSAALSSLIPLFLLLAPGVAMRHSQVTNQVLAAVFVTAVIDVATGPQLETPRRMAWAGFLVGLATLAKLTGLGAGAALLPAILSRPLRPSRLLGAAMGVAIPLAAWLAWALPVYGSPIPWSGQKLALWSTYHLVIPTGTDERFLFLHRFLRDFWYPYEWQAPAGAWKLIEEPTLVVASAILAASVGVGIAVALRRSPQRRIALVSLLSLAALAAGYAALSISRRWVFETDLREVYPYFGAVVLLVGMLAARVKHNLAVVLLVALVGLWLLNDVGFYVFGSCVKCRL